MNWHYAENGQQVGPVTDEQFSHLFQAGNVVDVIYRTRPETAAVG